MILNKQKRGVLPDQALRFAFYIDFLDEYNFESNPDHLLTTLAPHHKEEHV